MKRILFDLISIMLLKGCQTNHKSSTETQTYSYSPDKICSSEYRRGGNRYFIQSLSELEKRATENSFGVIAVCEVAGDSINRIIEPKEDLYAYIEIVKQENKC